jgi:hypothetical protein
VTGLGRSFGFYCDAAAGPNAEVTTSMQLTGVDSVSTGPLVYQDLGTSTNPGAEFTYLSHGTLVTQAAYDPKATIDSLEQIRAAGKRAICKSLFYALGDETPVTDLNPGSTDAAMTWCERYYTNVLAPLLEPSSPSGAAFDILNLQTELNDLSRYAEAWISLIEEIRHAGFSGIMTCSANDPSITNTPWATHLDWFGYDCYPPVSNDTYIGTNPVGNASDSGQLAAFLAAYVAQAIQTASNQFGGIPVFLGEFSFGIGPAYAPASPPVLWSDQEWTTLTQVFFEVLAPLACWAGVTWWRWPYDHPDGTPTYPPPALLEGLSQGWTSSSTAPDPVPTLALGPMTPRTRHPRRRTVLPAPATPLPRSRRR